MQDPVLVAGARTPSGIQEAILGNVLQAGLGQNPARALRAGSGVVIPTFIPATDK